MGSHRPAFARSLALSALLFGASVVGCGSSSAAPSGSPDASGGGAGENDAGAGASSSSSGASGSSGSSGAGGDSGAGSTVDGSVDGATACTGLECAVPDCGDGGSPTDLHGTVYAPNGTLPLWNVNVYIPNGDPGAVKHGVDGTCDTCSSALAGHPVVATTTKEDGTFLLPNIPVADNLPVVIQIGKWRKQLTLHTRPTACKPTLLPAIDTTLPASRTAIGGDVVSVDMPQIALSTGSADALECFLRKLGIADSEFTTDSGSGRVNLFADTQALGEGASKFEAGFAGGAGNFTDSQTLWNTFAKLATYDITILSCEGAQYAGTKSQAAMNAVKQYADMGGRLLMTHWHNVWIEGNAANDAGAQAPAVWPAIATFNNSNTTYSGTIDDGVDETNNPAGASFATWLVEPQVATTNGPTTRDLVPVTGGKNTCSGVDETKAERWLTTPSPAPVYPQVFQFTTPNEVPLADRCGKVMFSDMHASSDSTSSPGTSFPDGCSTGPLTPQEKALAFMFFQVGACVDVTHP